MKTARVPAGLEHVHAELEAWQGQRRKGDRIPEGVWHRAAGAVRQYGLNAVSRALRLDYYHLKRRAAGQQPLRQQTSPVFVEFRAVAHGPEGPLHRLVPHRRPHVPGLS